MRRSLALVIFSILFLSTHLLQAAYLRNIEMTITQPDGTVIHCYASGDEFHNWLHDKNNYTIIRNTKDGYYYYAKKENGKIIPSTYKVTNTPFKSTVLKPGVNLSAQQIKTKRKRKLANLPSFPKSSKFKGTETVKNINQLCIYIRFNDDDEFSMDTSKYYDWLNSEAPNESSVYNYYKTVTYNTTFIKSEFYPKSSSSVVVSFKDVNERGFYEPYDETSNPDGYDPDEDDRTNNKNEKKREWNLLERAIDSLNANYTIPAGVDLDYDDDGNIDNVVFFIKGNTGEWNELLWPHNFSIYDRTVKINGLKVFNYNFQIESATNSRGVGVLCHEMGHMLGYPDLYHYEDDGINYDPVYKWDIMATTLNPPQSFTAYTKYQYGKWISEIPEITEDGTYTLYPVDTAATENKKNCYKIASPYSETEYFVLEYRRKSGIFESSIPRSGLLISRINTEVPSEGNAQGPPDEIYIIRPEGAENVNGKINEATLSSDYDYTSVDNYSSHVFLSDGNPAGLYISEVGTIGETISFKVELKPNALYPDFSADKLEIYARNSVTFTDNSKGNPDSWEWTFQNGTPATYSGQNPPKIKFNTEGAHNVSLTVTKDGKSLTKKLVDYIIATELPGAVPPQNLTSQTNGANVTLNWDPPADIAQEYTLRWDDGNIHTSIGNGSSSGTFEALSHWEPDDLAPYDDMYVTALSFYVRNSSSNATVKDFTLKIYSGENAGDELKNIPISSSKIKLDQINTIDISIPVQIDASKHYYFGFKNDSGTDPMGYPFGVDNGPAIAGKGDIIKKGFTLSNLSDSDLDYNWLLFATVKSKLASGTDATTYILNKSANFKALNGYNIYRDEEKINTTVVSETTFTDSNLDAGTYKYYVVADYTGGESMPTNQITVEVQDNVGIPTNDLKEMKIYPNPVKDKLVLQLDKYTNNQVKLQIFDQTGKQWYLKEFNPKSDRIELNISNFTNGTYSLLFWSDEEIYKGKFIVIK